MTGPERSALLNNIGLRSDLRDYIDRTSMTQDDIDLLECCLAALNQDVDAIIAITIPGLAPFLKPSPKRPKSDS